MRWFLLGLAAIVALVLVVVVVGAMLPRDHTASRTAHFRASPDAVWRVITDLQAYPSWRNVQSVELLPPQNGHRAWRETDKHGDAMTLVAEEETPPQRMVTRIGPGLPFGGTWTYALAPASGGGTDLTITENGEVYNVIFRFVARVFIGYHATMDEYLEALGKRLNSAS